MKLCTDQGVLWLVQRYRLQVALLLFWATLLVLLWSMSGDLARHPEHDPATQIDLAPYARREIYREVAAYLQSEISTFPDEFRLH